MTQFNSIASFTKITIACITLGMGLQLSSCATSSLARQTSSVQTQKIKQTLVRDRVMAFGKPGQVIANIPTQSIVIVGEKNSYIITQGGSQFVKLITNLDAKNIKITKELAFLSEKNDGNFQGKLPLTYIKLKEDVTKADKNFFIENGAVDCTSGNDARLDAQRFCFDIKIVGYVFPQIKNMDAVRRNMRALSKPYHVSIYNYSYQRKSVKGKSAGQTLLLAPFAIAFDIVTLPLQALDEIFD